MNSNKNQTKAIKKKRTCDGNFQKHNTNQPKQSYKKIKNKTHTKKKKLST